MTTVDSARQTAPHRMSVVRIAVRAVGPGLLVELWDDAGNRGTGEASPLVDYSDESIADCGTALRALVPGALVVQARVPIDTQLPALLAPVAHVPAAAFALETALLDLLGRIRGVPIRTLLGAANDAPAVALNALVSNETEAIAAVRAGFTCLKLKLGRCDHARELDLVRRLRQRFDNTVALRFDVNRRWAGRDTRERLEELHAFCPEYVEEPTHALETLESPLVAIGLDESIAGEPTLDFDHVVEAHNVRVVVLKPMRLGGALRCLAIARRARSAGIEPIVTHMMDGPIALAAAAELAFTLSPSLACGLAEHANLSRWPFGPAPQICGPVARPLPTCGHGVKVP